jgi:hypothetical protein
MPAKERTMQLDSQVYLWIIIAIIIIYALFRSDSVRARFGKFSISADKAKKDKDTIAVEKIKQSKVAVENRDGQDVFVKDVSDNSDVKIK